MAHSATNVSRTALRGLRLLALLGGLAMACPTLADVIHLKNGNELQGEILQDDPGYLTVRFPNGVLRIPKREIREVEDESRVSYLLAEGEKHLARKDFRGAISYYRTAHDEAPDSSPARAGLIDAYEKLARDLHSRRLLNGARRAFRELLEEEPNHPSAHTEIKAIEREIEEIDTAAQRAIALIGGDGVAEGHQRLLELYNQYPEKRADLNKPLGNAAVILGNRSYSQENWDRAAKHYLEAVAFDPDQMAAIALPYGTLKLREIAPLAVEGRHEEVLRLSEEALAIVPSNDFLLYYRALGLHGTGRKREAAEIYVALSGVARPRDVEAGIDRLKRAAELKLSGRTPTAELVAEADEVLPGKWREVETEHFVVYHRNHRVGQAVARVAEQSYLRLLREFDCKTHWHKRCQVYIHPTRESFAESTGQHGWTGGSHTIRRRRGTLSDHRIESYQGQPRLTQGIIPHEVTHAMLAHRLRYQGNLPLWINEGMAIRSEPEVIRRYYRRLVDQALALGKEIDLGELVRMNQYPKDEERVPLFYAQSYSVCDMLIRRKGLKSFLVFSEQLAVSSASVTALLQGHYGIDGPKGLENTWRVSLRR